MDDKYVICFATVCPCKVEDTVRKYGGMPFSSIKEPGIPDHSVQCFYPENDKSVALMSKLVCDLPPKTDVTYIMSLKRGYVYARPSFLRSFSPEQRLKYDTKLDTCLSEDEYKLNKKLYEGSENIMLTYSPGHPNSVLMQVVIKVSDYYKSIDIPEIPYGPYKSSDLLFHRGKVDDHYGKPVYIGVSESSILLESKICTIAAHSWTNKKYSKRNVTTQICPLVRYTTNKIPSGPLVTPSPPPPPSPFRVTPKTGLKILP